MSAWRPSRVVPLGAIGACIIALAAVTLVLARAPQPPVQPPQPHAAPAAPQVPALSLTSATLLPPLTIGDRTIHTIRLRAELSAGGGGRGTIDLDPNPVALDRFGRVTKIGGRATVPMVIDVSEIPGPSAPPTSNQPAQDWKLYALRTVAPLPPNASPIVSGPAPPDWTGKVELRLAIAPGPCAPRRLLVLDMQGAILRIIPLDAE